MPSDLRVKLELSIQTYAMTGRGDVKAMQGSSTYRLRMGDHRVIFDETRENIRVLVIGNRKDIYR